jgi:hypothetical protein
MAKRLANRERVERLVLAFALAERLVAADAAVAARDSS